MRRAALLALLVVVAGCASFTEASPRTHLENTRQVYTASLQTATALAQSGVLDLKTAEALESVRVRLAAMIAEADTAIAAGAEFSFADLDASLDALKEILAIARAGVGGGD